MSARHIELKGHTPSRHAFTLVELMVALTIALVLTAVALPKVKEGLKQNVSTRTATMVKATFENARAQAIRSGRPFGVVLHRASNNVDAANSLNDPIVTAAHGANYCNRLSFVQMAFEYRGDIEGATVTFSAEVSAPAPLAARRPASIICSNGEAGLIYAIANGNILPKDAPVRAGNTLTLGGLTDAYSILNIVPFNFRAGDPTLPLPATRYARVYLQQRSPLVMAKPQFQTGDLVTFRFRTSPIASPMADVPLPGKAVIDLTCSGVGPNVSAFSPRVISDANDLNGVVPKTPPPNYVFDRPYAENSTTSWAYRNITIMFNGSGQLDSVYLDQYVAGSGPDNSTESDDYVYRRVPIADPVSLLIADVRGVVLPESMAVFPQRPAIVTTAIVPAAYEPTSDVTPNFVNSDNAWLTISPISGRVDLSNVVGPHLGTALSTPTAPSPLVDRHPELDPALVPAPTAANFIQARLFDSRRLARGTVQ